MRFSHPLARDAKVWLAHLADGQNLPTLVILTTLRLNADSKRFKKDKVERLVAAAKEFIAEYPDEIGSFVLINRPRDWGAREQE